MRKILLLLTVVLLASCSTTYRLDFSTLTPQEKAEFQRQYHARQNNVYLDTGFDYWNRPGWRGFYRNQWGWNLNGWYGGWGLSSPYYNQPIIITKPRYANTRNNNSVRSSNRSSGTTRRATVTRSSGTTRKATVTRRKN